MGAPAVLVVDDDAELRELLTASLGLDGYAVTPAASVAEALRAVAATPPALALVDLGLPDAEGIELVRMLSSREPPIPVIVLTGRDDVDEKVRALRTGADDYVTKPFHISEVNARVEAVLRRAAAPAGSTEAGTLRYADLVVDPENVTVRRGDEPIALTPTEYRLLVYLIENAERVLSKSQILDRIWQYDFGGDSGVVERFIWNLRRKVDDGRAPLIRTVRGFGYLLSESSRE
jgi:two-component system OmpR family response regulator